MSSRLLRRYVLPSDSHSFVARIYDLSIVSFNFESYDEVLKHHDAKYVLDVNDVLSTLTQRVESLNMVGNMLWPEYMPDNFGQFPLSRYQWLTVSADVFLMRYISVVDCVMILVNEVLEFGLAAKDCTVHRLKKCQTPKPLLNEIEGMVADQGDLRAERNGRFHHGAERGFSSDDQTFRMAAQFEHHGRRLADPKGRLLPVERYFREGVIELQREFNSTMRKLVRRLDRVYDILAPEFEFKFSPRFRAGAFAPNQRHCNSGPMTGDQKK